MLGYAVVGEQGVQEGTKHAPLRGPALRINVLLPTLTTWGRPYTTFQNKKKKSTEAQVEFTWSLALLLVPVLVSGILKCRLWRKYVVCIYSTMKIK